ncbi:hypothetical protein HMPREF1214_03288 [Bacteroides sp. HPS0048]|nr:hypothetical protein HMPREF1214_03288 [Bacteroides sp. HPS0048]
MLSISKLNNSRLFNVRACCYLYDHDYVIVTHLL